MGTSDEKSNQGIEFFYSIKILKDVISTYSLKYVPQIEYKLELEIEYEPVEIIFKLFVFFLGQVNS